MDRTLGRAARIALLIGAAAVVAGCSSGREGVGNLLGITRGSPDPFNVYPRAPLQVPQDLATLPAPQPGAASPLEPTPIADAQAAIGNAGAPVAVAGPSQGEVALLATAGANEADPDVRRTLAEDPALQREREFAFRTFFGYKVPDGTEKDLLEPREERKRLLEQGGAAPNPPPEKVRPSNVLF